MITYFTEFARWVGSTTGLVVSYVRGLLFNKDDDPTDSSITETTVHNFCMGLERPQGKELTKCPTL